MISKLANLAIGAYHLSSNPELVGPMAKAAAMEAGEGLVNGAYNRVFGRDLSSDYNALFGAATYGKRIANDPSIAAKDTGNYLLKKFLGKAQTETDLEALVKSILSGDFESQAAVKSVTQEELKEKSGDQYSGKRVFGLYSDEDGTIYLDSGLDEGMKYRTLLHEALERSSGRPNRSNDEDEHVAIEMNVGSALEYASKNFTGSLKQRAGKALEAYYRTVHEGAQAGDDFLTKVQSKLSEAELN